MGDLRHAIHFALRGEGQDAGSAPDSDQIPEHFSQACLSPARSPFRFGYLEDLVVQLLPLFPLPGVAVEGDVETPTAVFVLEGQAGVLLPILDSNSFSTSRTGAPALLDDFLHELSKRFSLFGVVQVPLPPFGCFGVWFPLRSRSKNAEHLPKQEAEHGIHGSDALPGGLSEFVEHPAGVAAEPPGQRSGVAEGFALDQTSNVVAQDIRFFAGISYVHAAMAELLHHPIGDFFYDGGVVRELLKLLCAFLRCGGFWWCICTLWTGIGGRFFLRFFLSLRIVRRAGALRGGRPKGSSTGVGGYNLLLLGFCPEEEFCSFPSSSFSVERNEHAVVNQISDPVSDRGGADVQEFGLLLGGKGDHGRAGALEGDPGHNAQVLVELQDLARELPVAP